VSVLHPVDFKKTVGTYHPQFHDHRQVNPQTFPLGDYFGGLVVGF